MAYTQTTELELNKAVPGTNQAFETSVINDNWDAVDAAIVADRADIAAAVGDIASLSTQVTDLEAGTSITAIDGGTA